MKYFFFLPLMLFVLACNNNKMSQQTRKEFQENHFNFKLDEEIRYASIAFNLPENFEKSYNKYYTVKGNSFVRESYPMGIKFSVEHYTAKDFKKYFIKESGFHVNQLNTLHDAYVDRRLNSLDEAGSTFKKSITKKKTFKGIVQVVSGEDNFSNDIVYYATATVKLKEDFYVFQWITTPEMLSYTMDDFERILYTIKKIK